MNKSDALNILGRLKPILARRYGVAKMGLFGSMARDQATQDSDIDILVTFNGPATSERYFGVQFMLEDELGRSVDLVTEKVLRKELRPYIENEVIHV